MQSHSWSCNAKLLSPTSTSSAAPRRVTGIGPDRAQLHALAISASWLSGCVSGSPTANCQHSRPKSRTSQGNHPRRLIRVFILLLATWATLATTWESALHAHGAATCCNVLIRGGPGPFAVHVLRVAEAEEEQAQSPHWPILPPPPQLVPTTGVGGKLKTLMTRRRDVEDGSSALSDVECGGFGSGSHDFRAHHQPLALSIQCAVCPKVTAAPNSRASGTGAGHW